MKRFRILIAALGITAAMLATGCIFLDGGGSDNASLTCNGFDSYLADCYPSCAATWDCEYYYDDLDFDTQAWLDDCSDCLAYSGTCADCSAGGYSCYQLLTDYLGISCDW